MAQRASADFELTSDELRAVARYVLLHAGARGREDGS